MKLQKQYSLEFYASSPGGSGGGAGTVTSVSTQSQSLKDLTAPNPIVNFGIIQFEVQIIDITYVACALLELGGGLLEGVIYRIFDFAQPIGNGVILRTCEFMTVKNRLGVTVLSSRGTAHSVGFKVYEISYNLQADFITELYLPEFNQRASRDLNSPSNNIESLPWEVAACTNFRVVESDFLNISGVAANVISDSEIFNSTIDWNSNAGSITAGTRVIDSEVSFFNSGAFIGCLVNPGCVLAINAIQTRVSWGTGITQTVDVNVLLTDVRVGAGETTWNFTNTAATRTKRTFESALNEFQKYAPANAGTDTITDSWASYIFVHLHPDVAPAVVTYTLFMPAAPVPGQIVNIGCDEAMAGVTINGNGNTVQSNVAVFAKNQGVSFYFNLPDTTWYLVN